MELNPFSSVVELGALLRAGKTTSAEITRFYLDRIKRFDGDLNAFTQVDEERAMQTAAAHDQLLSAGVDLGPLHGIPVAVKDLLHWKGTACTAGSNLLRDSFSTENSDVVQRLVAAGAVIIGKTQLVEFAFGGWGTNAAYGAPMNPWDTQIHRIPGGSSSGSGVAVAAGLVPAAIGTDTGGSVRIPASFNGIVGLKPSHGKISTDGCIPLSTTLDSIGPMTRTVEDSAIIYRCLASGADAIEEISAAAPRLGVLDPKDIPSTTTEEVKEAYYQVIENLKAEGWLLETIELPFALESIAELSGDIITAEAYQYHCHNLEQSPELYWEVTSSKLLRGAEISSERYLSLMETREKYIREFREALRSFDALLTPTTGFTAISLAEVDESKALMSSYTRPVNYVDGCGLSLPYRLDGQGLPLSLQLVSVAGNEERLLNLGSRLERLLDFSETPAAYA